MAAGYLGAVDDIAFGIDADFVVHAADAADFGDMPNFAERFVGAGGCRLHLQLLETVFTAVLARMRTCDALGARKRDRLLRHTQESFGGLSASSLGLRRAGASTSVWSVGPPARATSSRNPPIAPITPAASAGRKIVVPFP